MNILQKCYNSLLNRIIHNITSQFENGDKVILIADYGAVYQVTIEDVEMCEEGWIYTASDLFDRHFFINHFPSKTPKHPIHIQHYSSYTGDLIELAPTFDLQF